MVRQQQATDGVVQIAVIEGYVAKIRTEGAPDDDRVGIVKCSEENITAMQPLSGQALDHYVQLLNDLCGVQVAVILEPLTGPRLECRLATASGEFSKTSLSLAVFAWHMPARRSTLSGIGDT